MKIECTQSEHDWLIYQMITGNDGCVFRKLEDLIMNPCGIECEECLEKRIEWIINDEVGENK